MDHEQSQLQFNGALMNTVRAYFLITKPGILMGNAITAFGGFALASKLEFHLSIFLAMIAGLSGIIASACIFNNYIDRTADEKMERTKNRGFVTGQVKQKNAIVFAVFLGLSGTFLLAYFTNLLTVWLALSGFFIYIALYTFFKYRTVHATVIGSFAGAVPPVAGYCAASGQFDLCASLLFAVIMLWQMPHFYAISIYRLEEYKKAAIPVLPLKKGIRTAKISMAVYVVAFTAACCLLTLFHFTGSLFLAVSALLGAAWLVLCLKGFKSSNDQLWARKMFIFSLVVVTTLSFTLPFS